MSDTGFIIVNPQSQSLNWQRDSPFPTAENFGVSTQIGSGAITFSVQFENTSVEWLDLAGDVDLDYNTVVFAAGSGNANIVVLLKNINLLSGSFYTAKIRFTRGFLTRTHTVNLNITGAFNPVKTEKNNYSVFFNRLTNQVTGDLNVAILNNNNLDNLYFETIGTLFLEKTVINNFTLEEDPAFPFLTNPELPQTGSKVVNGRLIKDNGDISTTFTITINVVNTNDITSDLSVLNFTQYRHLGETKTAIIKLSNPGSVPFNVNFPTFINVTPISGSTSVDLTIDTENSASLLAQKYTGDIEITFSGKNLKIPVTVNNIDFIDFPVSDYNFCLDDFRMSIKRISDTATRVRIKLAIQIESPEGNVNIEPAYQIAYFNDQATTDIGRKVHQHFPVFSKPVFENPGVEFNNVFIYKPANVAVTIEELDANYDVVFTKTISDIKLFPGKKPKMFPVFSNLKQKRFYADTGHLFSYLTTEVQPSDIVGKTVSNNPFSVDEINSVFFEDRENLMSFGDYKQILGIDFMRIPKGHNQIFVQFINQNLVPELTVFNGFFQFNEDYTHNYEDAEGFSEKYDSSVIKKAVLQTGYLFKEESKMIEELCKSPLTFIKIENDVYESFPIPGKMTSQNSESNLVIFEIEFLIVLK